MTTITLNDGNKIPAVGFGVFMIPADGPTYDAVRTALDAGYRHIDTAAAYFNEADVGRAVRDSGIPREEIFITSKLWLQDYGYEAAKKGLDTSLEKLGMDYVDLYLLHQPYGDVAGAWKALEEAKAAGKVRSIGVSNMTPKIWKEFVPQFKTLPAVNQVECNPFFQQRELRELLAKDDVKIEAYQPLGHGDSSLLSHPVIAKLAEKYGKNAGQIILRFEVQDGLIVLPKSTNPERIAGNLRIFDFELTEDEMNQMYALDTGKGSHDPEAPGVAEMLLQNYKIHDCCRRRSCYEKEFWPEALFISSAGDGHRQLRQGWNAGRHERRLGRHRGGRQDLPVPQLEPQDRGEHPGAEGLYRQRGGRGYPGRGGDDRPGQAEAAHL